MSFNQSDLIRYEITKVNCRYLNIPNTFELWTKFTAFFNCATYIFMAGLFCENLSTEIQRTSGKGRDSSSLPLQRTSISSPSPSKMRLWLCLCIARYAAVPHFSITQHKMNPLFFLNFIPLECMLTAQVLQIMASREEKTVS